MPDWFYPEDRFHSAYTPPLTPKFRNLQHLVDSMLNNIDLPIKLPIIFTERGSIHPGDIISIDKKSVFDILQSRLEAEGVIVKLKEE